MAAVLYSLSLSNPSQAARVMLERKGIEHEVRDLMPGMHPARVRAAGFRRATVPALRLDDGRRIQGSRTIARELDALVPSPPLFPEDPGARRAVEEAEEWGELEFQPIPRRLFRWGTVHRPHMRRWLAADVIGLPAPGVGAWLSQPVTRALARQSGAGDAAVREDLANLEETWGRVGSLMSEGVIGGPEPNAADFQIFSTVCILVSFADLRPRLEGRPETAHARALFPGYDFDIPPILPAEWLGS